MAQPTVSQLKELLFDKEAREIDALAARVDRVYDRAGDDAQLRTSVARVIDGALREAETTRHRELADAMAPVVVRTVRTEITSPQMQDEIAGALYPKMGEMVRRFVASAMRDLMENINRRLESGLANNPLMLRLRSLTSGRSMAELALAQSQRLEIEEVYLVRRGSGELIERWTRGDVGTPGAGGNRDTLVSGFLTAITSFAEEAFAADRESLRALDLDDHRIYLRASPAHLLALKCRGSAPAGVEGLLDSELLAVLKDLAAPGPAGGGGPKPRPLIEGLVPRLEASVAERAAGAGTGGGLKPIKVVAWLIGLPLLALVGWQATVAYKTHQVQWAADGVLAARTELRGYPVTARAERGGGGLTVVGLTPGPEARQRLLDDLAQRFAVVRPGIRITDTLGVLPQADVETRIRSEGLRVALAGIRQRLASLASDLGRIAGRLREAPARAVVQGAQQTLAAALADLGPDRSDLDESALGQRVATAASKLAQIDRSLVALSGTGRIPADAVAPAADPRRSMDQLRLVAERISVRAVALEEAERAASVQAQQVARLETSLEARLKADFEARHAASLAEQERRAGDERARLQQAMEARIADLMRQLEGLRRTTTPREALDRLVREEAIFFATGTEFRESAAAAATLDKLAGLMKQTQVLVRVVGYTDDAGGQARNGPLSQQRADMVVEALATRGVPRARLVAIGRATAVELAPRTGASAINRRVEFEIGFAGEDAAQR